MVARFSVNYYDGAGGATSLAVSESGNIYVSDSGNHSVRFIATDGIVSTLAGTPGKSGYRDGPGQLALFTTPAGLAFDRAGNLYVADTGNHVIRKIDRQGAVTTVAGRGGKFGYRDGVATNALFNAPSGVAVAPDGTLYVADSGNHTLRVIGPAGAVTTLAGSPQSREPRDGFGTNAWFLSLFGIALSPDGQIWITDPQANAVRTVSPAGDVVTVAGQFNGAGLENGPGALARFYQPMGLVIDSDGSVLVADGGNQVIRRITPDGNVTSVVGVVPPGGGGIYHASVHADGLALFARFDAPSSLAFDQQGHLLVADARGTIRRGSFKPETRPHLLVQPHGESVPVGQTVAFHVVAEPGQSLAYQWMFAGMPIVGGTNDSLLLPSVEPARAGEYRVALADEFGFVLSAPATLQVAAQEKEELFNLWHPVARSPLTRLRGLARGTDRFVGIGDAGGIVDSPDGGEWNRQPPVTLETLNGIAFGANKFVVVGNNGVVLTSADGLAWETHRLTPEGAPDLHGIAYDQDLFVAVSSDVNGSIWSSTDGVVWVNRGVGLGVSLMAVTAGGGRFVAVGNTVVSSTDGNNWSPGTGFSSIVGQDLRLTHVAYGNFSFLASQSKPTENCEAGQGLLFRSRDGRNWVQSSSSGSVVADAIYANGKFVATSADPAGVSFSTDGGGWGQPIPVGDGALIAADPNVAYAAGTFVGSSGDGNLFTSSDAKRWSVRNQNGAFPLNTSELLWIGDHYVSAGQGLRVSSSGVDWRVTLQTNQFRSLCSGQGKVVAVGGTDRIFVSEDGGMLWTDRSPALGVGTAVPDLEQVIAAGDQFVAIGSSVPSGQAPRGHLLLSANAVRWDKIENTPLLTGIAYGNGTFVGIDSTRTPGRAFVSTNARTWNPVVSLPNTGLFRVLFGNDRFVIGGDGFVFTSRDAASWARRRLTNVYLGNMVYGNGLFAASSGSLFFSSIDGSTWTTTEANINLATLFPGQGCFLAISPENVADASVPSYALCQSLPIQHWVLPHPSAGGPWEWTVTTAPHTSFQIEASDDLYSWRALVPVSDSAGEERFRDPDAANRPRRFYRTRRN